MRRGLQVLLGIIGAVMTVAGLATVIAGSNIIFDNGTVAPSVDSELRFYGAWYTAMGVVLLSSLARIESATLVVRAVGAGFFIAACGRALSIADLGRPHGQYVALMIVEFIIPLVIVPWQARIARSERGVG